ncbi:hypothetical protein KIPB_011259 [Kipferlia bialata]|uniref:Uncharacterized protein n=1 Tax=Kipferlia bialata TaxID=797122 RepID=A0A9K3D5E3_9EUKA|nr:hypothetical protein KIPB_011259 [Kipferlia bialata]|eukprot:g11259.t1
MHTLHEDDTLSLEVVDAPMLLPHDHFPAAFCVGGCVYLYTRRELHVLTLDDRKWSNVPIPDIGLWDIHVMFTLGGCCYITGRLNYTNVTCRLDPECVVHRQVGPRRTHKWHIARLWAAMSHGKPSVEEGVVCHPGWVTLPCETPKLEGPVVTVGDAAYAIDKSGVLWCYDKSGWTQLTPDHFPGPSVDRRLGGGMACMAVGRWVLVVQFSRINDAISGPLLAYDTVSGYVSDWERVPYWKWHRIGMFSPSMAICTCMPGEDGCTVAPEPFMQVVDASYVYPHPSLHWAVVSDPVERID